VIGDMIHICPSGSTIYQGTTSILHLNFRSCIWGGRGTAWRTKFRSEMIALFRLAMNPTDFNWEDR